MVLVLDYAQHPAIQHVKGAVVVILAILHAKEIVEKPALQDVIRSAILSVIQLVKADVVIVHARAVVRGIAEEGVVVLVEEDVPRLALENVLPVAKHLVLEVVVMDVIRHVLENVLLVAKQLVEEVVDIIAKVRAVIHVHINVVVNAHQVVLEIVHMTVWDRVVAVVA